MDVDNDTSKDDPAVNPQAVLSHLQENQCTPIKPLEQITETIVPGVHYHDLVCIFNANTGLVGHGNPGTC